MRVRLADGRACSSLALGADRGGSTRACRPASCPTRTRATSSCSVQAPRGRVARLHDATSRAQVEAVLPQGAGDRAACSRSAGFSFARQRRRTGACIFVSLKPIRRAAGRGALGAGGRRQAAAAPLGAITRRDRDPVPAAVDPAALGAFGGFQFELLDQSGGPHREPRARPRSELVGAGQPDAASCAALFTQLHRQRPAARSSTIDREKAKSLGHAARRDHRHAADASSARQYVNDFDFNNRSYRVYVQADQQFRSRTRRTSSSSTCGPAGGQMVPLDNVVRGRARRPRRRSSATTTCSARPRSTGRAAPGLQLGPGARRRWRTLARTRAAAGLSASSGRACRSRRSRRAASRSSSSGSGCCSST